ncbi:MAG: Ig-like domain-containing protein [Solirubrobacterales bacterium]
MVLAHVLRRRCRRTLSLSLSLLALASGALLAGGVLAGAALAPTATAAEAGVNLSSLSPGTMQQATALGAHWVRVFAPWKFFEPSRGVHAANWLVPYDQLLSSLPKGTHAIFDVVGTPAWESGSGAGNAPPSNAADYASLLHFLAQRWAGKVSAYEIWNEEDSSRWWAGAPDPTAYTRLLQAAYPAVKSADPNAEVVLGGLTGNDYSFLQGIYSAGGRGYFDAVGVHTDTACNINSPYTFLRNPDGRLEPDSFLGYREVHATEVANGDDKPIWMTETSWRTTSAMCPEGAFAGQKPEGVSEVQQATYLQQAYHCLAEDPYVQLALWYPLVDEGPVVSGLMHSNGAQKPAYAAMRSYLEHGDQLTGACGNFAGPKITPYNPHNGQRYTGRLRIKVVASDPVGIRRVRLFDDGHLVRNWVPFLFTHTYPQSTVASMRWFGAYKLSTGRHVLTIVAIDRLENVSSLHLTIVHLREHRRHSGLSHY